MKVLAAILAIVAALAAVGAGSAPVTVLIATELGDIRAVVSADHAPRTAANFLRYVRAGHYEGGRFHRTVRLDNQPGKDVLIEVIQAGVAPSFDSKPFPPVPLQTARRVSPIKCGRDTSYPPREPPLVDVAGS